MASSNVSFLEPYGNPDSGVDHLGLRVAGEAAYSKLIDFITTVAWRPRYYSFLCWALQQAWEASSKKEKDGSIKVNKTLQSSIIKRLDYTVAASTLLLNSSAQRIAGSETINKRLSDPRQYFPVKADHLRNTRGSYDIYVGSMRNLGLVETANNVDRPSQTGKQLAQIYQESIGLNEKLLLSSIEEKRQFSTDELRLIGEISDLSGLAGTKSSAPIKNELQKLQQMLFGAVTPHARRLSVGLILHAHILMDGPVSLDHFRSLTLLDGVRTGDGNIAFELPENYQTILPQWATYQSHAYTTYALESLLSIVLDRAAALEAHKGEGVDIPELLDFILSEMSSEDDSLFAFPNSMHSWWELSVNSFEVQVTQQVKQGYNAKLAEPDLYAVATSGMSSARLSFLLFFFCVVRLKILMERNGVEAWIGSQDPFRLPPQKLVQDLQNFTIGSKRVADYALYVIHQYVINQHYQNAMRKLAATPSLDSSRFSWEGDRIVPNGSHQAGTSNPRYDNAVFCLCDLGYLSEDRKVTATGYQLLKEIEGRSS
jgi:hypothetical protein